MKVYGIIEKTCPVCKKVFIKAPQHAYKYRDNKGQCKYVCSYTCLRKIDLKEVKK